MTFYDPQADPPAELEVLAAVIGATIDGAWVQTNWENLPEDIKDSMRSAALGVYTSEWMRQYERQAQADILRKMARRQDPFVDAASRNALIQQADELEAENDPSRLV